MSMFDAGDFKKYKSEAEEKWGKTEAYKEHAQKTKQYSGQKWNSLAAEMDLAMGAFAICMSSGASPASGEAQVLVKKLQSHICENYYNCTDEILYGLGQMYICDDRFRKNIDKHGEGTAAFISEAIKVYCGKEA